MKTTVEEFLRLCGEDTDVYDDYDERCGVCYCPPIELTELGRAVFARALNLEIEWEDGEAAIVECPTGKDAQAAKDLFESLAGYCGCEEYDAWFREPVGEKPVMPEVVSTEQKLHNAVNYIIEHAESQQEIYNAMREIGYTDEWIFTNLYLPQIHTYS